MGKSWRVWKTIEIGFIHSSVEMLKRLEEKGFSVSTWAKDILSKVSFSVTKQKVDLVLVTVAELGFPDGAKIREIFAKAKELGLLLCPAEVGLYLRLDYSNQPRGEWLIIGMEPVSDSGGGLGLFCVNHDSYDRWLDAFYGYPDDFWNSSNRFVFMLRK